MNELKSYLRYFYLFCFENFMSLFTHFLKRQPLIWDSDRVISKA